MGRRLIFEVCANCGKKITDDEKALLVDDHNDLIFCDEDCLRENFEVEIEKLEDEHLSLRSKDDIPLTDFKKYENLLPLLLNEPDEVWDVATSDDEAPLCFFIGEFLHEKEQVYYVAAIYMNEDKPAFVYMHFPTKYEDLVNRYRRGELIYDGDELTFEEDMEGELDDDNLASQLYSEMLEHRSDSDIDLADFPAYAEFKIATVEEPSEVWRRIDDSGNTVMVYIAQYEKDSESVGYVVFGIEDDITESVIPVFGFPTLDQALIDRFRKGESVFKLGEDF